jgi:NodT family efflux transporter outer membrane factor (OMF) lipoprotein
MSKKMMSRLDTANGHSASGSVFARRVVTRIETSGIVLLLSMVSMIVSGCVGPAYVRPKTEVPDTFKEMEGWKTGQPQDSLRRGSWWKIFNDSILDSLENQAALSNQTIVVAEAQYRGARAAVRASRAGYFPSLGAQASYSRAQRSTTMGATNATVQGNSATTYSDYLLSGDVSWEPDIWGRVRRLVQANKAQAQASAADLESVKLSIQAALAQDYFQLRIVDEQKRILDSAVTVYQDFFDLTTKRYKSGVAAQADILQAQTQLKTTTAQAIDAGVLRSQLEHSVAVLIGKPPSLFSVPPAPLTVSVPAIPVVVASRLLERRPDVAGAERRVAAANAQIGVAIAAYFPNVALDASGGYETGTFTKWFSMPSLIWSLGAAAAGTLFDAGLRRAQVDEARAAYEATVAGYRQTVLTAFQEVEDNLAGLRILEQEALVQGEAVTAARQSVVVMVDRYKQGIASALDVITTQTVELNNLKTSVALLGNRVSAAVLLIKALGGGWDVTQLPTAHEVLSRKDKKTEK